MGYLYGLHGLHVFEVFTKIPFYKIFIITKRKMLPIINMTGRYPLKQIIKY